MKYIVTLRNKNYEVEVESGEAKLISTTDYVPTAAPVAAAPAAAPVAAAPAAASVAAGEQVLSPMPGKILDIKVSAGQAVKKGDTLLILEALKMENEISAPRDGKIIQVVTEKGATVDTGSALIVLG